MESGTRTRRNRHLGPACLPRASSPQDWKALEELPLSPASSLVYGDGFADRREGQRPDVMSCCAQARAGDAARTFAGLRVTLQIEGKLLLLPALSLSAHRACAESSRSHTLNRSGGRALGIGMRSSVSCAGLSHTSLTRAIGNAVRSGRNNPGLLRRQRARGGRSGGAQKHGVRESGSRLGRNAGGDSPSDDPGSSVWSEGTMGAAGRRLSASGARDRVRTPRGGRGR